MKNKQTFHYFPHLVGYCVCYTYYVCMYNVYVYELAWKRPSVRVVLFLFFFSAIAVDIAIHEAIQNNRMLTYILIQTLTHTHTLEGRKPITALIALLGAMTLFSILPLVFSPLYFHLVHTHTHTIRKLFHQYCNLFMVIVSTRYV